MTEETPRRTLTLLAISAVAGLWFGAWIAILLILGDGHVSIRGSVTAGICVGLVSAASLFIWVNWRVGNWLHDRVEQSRFVRLSPYQRGAVFWCFISTVILTIACSLLIAPDVITIGLAPILGVPIGLAANEGHWKRIRNQTQRDRGLKN